MRKKLFKKISSFLKLFILSGIILGAILFISQSFKAKAAVLQYKLSITITSASTDTTDGNGNYYMVEKVTVYFGDGETTINLGSLNGSGTGTVISTEDANVVNFLAYGKVITNSDYYRTFGKYNGGNGAIGNGKTAKCEDSNYSPISPIIYTATINYNASKSTIEVKDDITPTVTIEGWKYGETANNPSVSGNLGNGDVTYHYKAQNADDSTYTTTKPSNAGNYTVRATIVETDDYNSGVATANFTISKANITPTVTMEGWTYGEPANNPSVSGNLGNGDVTYHYKAQGADDTTYTIEKPSNAGNYTVKAEIAETTNYNSATATTNFTISMANITPTVSMSGWTYGESANNPTVSGNIGNGEVTYEYKAQDAADSTYVTTKPSTAGDYTVRASIAATDNSSFGVATINFTISKAYPQVTAPIAKTNLEYTGSAQELVSAGSTTGGEIQYKLDSGSYSTTIPTATDIGIYTIYYKVVGDQNYNDVAESSAQATIVKGSINPTVSINNWTYGDTPSVPTISGNSGNATVTYEYKVQGANDSTYVENVPTNAGSYTIRATIIETANYNSGVATANFTISKADPQVTPPTAKNNLEYTGSEQELINKGSTSAGEMQYKLGDGEWLINIPTAANVGDYVIYYKVIGNDNYNDDAGGSILVSINKKILTITANNKTITYGDMPTNAGVVYSGFIGTDDESVLDGNLEITYNYEQFGNAGNYSIIPSGLVSSDYNIQFVSGVLSVNPLDITVTIVPKSSIYGENQVELESLITSGELINNDTNVYSISCSVNATSNVGTYDIIGINSNSNYNITFKNGTNAYTVTKKELIVTSKPKTIIYGDMPLNDGVTYSGFVNDDNEASLDGEILFTFDYEQYGNVGQYSITPSGLTSTNYNITFVNGVLTVAAKPITVIISAATSVYGETQAELIGEASGIVNDDENVYELSSEVNEFSAVGAYDITCTDISDNYIVTFENGTNAYTVTKKELIITAKPKRIIYGDMPSNDGVTYFGFVNDDNESSLAGDISFEYNYEQYGNVGNYSIIPSGLTSTNYEIVFENGLLTVDKKDLSITAKDKTIIYGDMPSNDGVTYSGFVNDDNESSLDGEILFTFDYEQYGNVGQYSITPSGLTSTNYNITFVNGVLTVAAKPITVIISAATSVYGETQAELIGKASGIVNDDENVYTLSSEVNEFSAVGAYDITGTDISDNYIVTFENGTNAYTVTKKELIITAKSKTIIYGDMPSNDGVTYSGFVNDDNESSLAGDISFEYNYDQYGNVGNYSIIPSGLTSTNYEIVFENGILTVDKKDITLNVDEKSIKCGDNLPALTFRLSEVINDNDYDELTEKTVIKSNADKAVPGRYDITMSFKDNYNKDNVLTNYFVTIKNNYIYVLTNSLKPSTLEDNDEADVEVLFDDENLVFDYDVRVEVEVKTDVKAIESNIDYKEIEEKYIDKNSEISRVYDVKLVRITTNDAGKEIIEEIQPSDIAEGAVIIVKMNIPEHLIDKTFRILHIHSMDDIEFISDENIEIKAGYVYAKTDKLSDFAFVTQKSNNIIHSSFCIGWIMIILDLICLIYLVVVIKMKKNKYDIIGILLSAAIVIFGIIAICIHTCLIMIIGIIIAIIIMLIFLLLNLIIREKNNFTKEQ